MEELSAAVRAVETTFVVHGSAAVPWMLQQEEVVDPMVEKQSSYSRSYSYASGSASVSSSNGRKKTVNIPTALVALEALAADKKEDKKDKKDKEEDGGPPPAKQRRTTEAGGKKSDGGGEAEAEEEEIPSSPADMADFLAARGLLLAEERPEQEALEGPSPPGDKKRSKQEAEEETLVLRLGGLAGAAARRNQAAIADVLARGCEPAPFGHGAETVFDDGVRKALCVPRSRILATAVDLESLGIMERVREELCPGWSGVRARLHKLNVYSTGGHFAAHKDTPYSEDVFGTVVVCLPHEFTGGDLVLDHGGIKRTLEWNVQTGQMFPKSSRSYWDDSEVRPRLQWAAFFGHVEHEVKRVTSGHRITLAFTLHRDLSDASVLSADARLLERLEKQLADSTADRGAGGAAAPDPSAAAGSTAEKSASELWADWQSGEVDDSSLVTLRAELMAKKLPELKAACKEQSLPVSGAKGTLVDRLAGSARDHKYRTYRFAELQEMKLPPLKAICKARKLKVSGSKDDLISRIVEHMGAPTPGIGSAGTASSSMTTNVTALPAEAMRSGVGLLAALRGALSSDDFLPDGGRLAIACTHAYERASDLPQAEKKKKAATPTAANIQLKGRDAVVFVALSRSGLAPQIHRLVRVPEVGWAAVDMQKYGKKNLLGPANLAQALTFSHHVEGYPGARCIDVEDDAKWSDSAADALGVGDDNWLVSFEDDYVETASTTISQVHYSGTGYYGNEASSDTMYSSAAITFDVPDAHSDERKALVGTSTTDADALAFIGLKLATVDPKTHNRMSAARARQEEEEKWEKKRAQANKSRKKAKAKRRAKARASGRGGYRGGRQQGCAQQ